MNQVDQVKQLKEQFEELQSSNLEYSESDCEFIKSYLKEYVAIIRSIHFELQNSESWDQKVLARIIKTSNELFYAFRAKAKPRIMRKHVKKATERIIVMKLTFILSCKQIKQIDRPAYFYFNVIVENECYTRIHEYIPDAIADFSKVFHGFDLKMKNLKLFGKEVMPDPSMKIIREADVQHPSGFRYYIVMFGKKFHELKPNSFKNGFDIHIVPIDESFLQPEEFIGPLSDSKNDPMRIKIEYIDSITGEIIESEIFEGTGQKCVDHLKNCYPATFFVCLRSDPSKKIEFTFGMFNSDTDILKVSNLAEIANLSESNCFREGTVLLLNFMHFQVKRANVDSKLYECLRTDLTKVGKSQLEILDRHLRQLNTICLESKTVYARFVALIQSSGFGKSKLCIELLRKYPGMYLVFRTPGQSGVPRPAQWMVEFGTYIFSAPLDELPFIEADVLKANANEYTSGRFLICLYRMAQFYKAKFDKAVSESKFATKKAKIKDAIRKLASYYLVSPRTWSDFSISFAENEIISMRSLLDGIKTTLESISRSSESTQPFLVFIDEADVFSSGSRPGRMPGINVIRRALHALNLNTKIMVVAIGTNSDALDFTPAVRDNSLRDLNRNNVLSPIIFTHNWDVLADSLKLGTVEMTPKLLLNRAFFNVLVALGRPMWASLSVEDVISIATGKLKNGNPDCVAALVARLLARANLQVNVHHVLARTLVRSYMVVVNYISTDARSMKIGYSSEPMLAFAARKLLQGTEKRGNSTSSQPEESKEAEAARAASFRALKRMVEHKAIDKGRLVEFMFEQLVLFAADDAEINNPALNFTNDPNNVPVSLKAICKRSGHIFQSEGANSQNQAADSSPLQAGPRTYIPINDYRVMTVATFLCKLFGAAIFDEWIRPKLSDAVLLGLVNVSHFVQLERADPEDFENLYKVDSRKTGPVIDRALLNCGIMRFCGYVMPQNYPGIDFIVPFVMAAPEDEFGRTVFSFIAFQSKATRTTIHHCAYKMVAVDHLIRCPIAEHKDAATCQSKRCTASFTEAEMNLISQCQVTILLSAKHETKTVHDSTFTTFCVDGDVYKKKFQKLTDKKSKLKDNESKPVEKKKLEKEINDIKSHLEVMMALSDCPGIPKNSRTLPVSYPKMKDSENIAKPDRIVTHSLDSERAVQQLFWNHPTDRSLICIAAFKLDCFQHLVGKDCLTVMKDLADLDPSNLHSVEPILLPMVQDSMINGVFSPYTELNPLLRSKRGLKPVADPLTGYHDTVFTPNAWEASVKEAAIGPLEEEIKSRPKPRPIEEKQLSNQMADEIKNDEKSAATNDIDFYSYDEYYEDYDMI